MTASCCLHNWQLQFCPFRICMQNHRQIRPYFIRRRVLRAGERNRDADTPISCSGWRVGTDHQHWRRIRHALLATLRLFLFRILVNDMREYLYEVEMWNTKPAMFSILLNVTYSQQSATPFRRIVEVDFADVVVRKKKLIERSPSLQSVVQAGMFRIFRCMTSFFPMICNDFWPFEH